MTEILIRAVLLMFGCLVGSFLNVCIYRIPEKKSIVFPPSHCPQCNAKLKPRDLIPVFSYLALRGRCRFCQGKISIQYPIIESVTGIVFCLLYDSPDNLDIFLVLFNPGLSAFFYLLNAALMAALICAFVIDLRYFEIPNSIVLFILGLAVLKTVFISQDYGQALLGAVACSGVFLGIYLLGLLIAKTEVLGMGDIKILFALGAYLGVRLVVLMTYLAIFLAAFLAIYVILAKKKKRFPNLPMAPFFCVATFTVLMWSEQITSRWLPFLGQAAWSGT